MVGGEIMGLPERQLAGGGQLNYDNVWDSAVCSVREDGSRRLL